MPGTEDCRNLLVLLAVIIGITFITAGGCLRPETGTGTLTGTVSIGPLCPVEPCTISRDQLAAAYAARPITISTPGGSVLTTVTASPDTGYSVALEPGTYIVDVPHTGIGGSPDLPATVSIRSGETVRLDLSIDTGIR